MYIINLRKFSANTYSNISSVFSYSAGQITCTLDHLILEIIWDVSWMLFISYSFPPLFYSSTWLIFIDFTLRTWINSSPQFNLLMSLLKEVFISVTVFLISGISIWFFLMVSTSQLKLSIWFCILSPFSIIVSNILILVILNFLSNYNISVLSESVFDDRFISSKQLFFLSFCLAHCSLIENWISCVGHRYYFRDKHAFPSAFDVRFRVNLIRSLADFQVCCCFGYHLCITGFKFL